MGQAGRGLTLATADVQWLPGHSSVLTRDLLLRAVLVADITNLSQFPCPDSQADSKG